MYFLFLVPFCSSRWLGGGPAFSLQKWKSYESFLSLRKISHGKYKGLSVTSSKSITVIENEDVLAFIYTFMLHYSLSLYNPMCFLFHLHFCSAQTPILGSMEAEAVRGSSCERQ